MRIGLGVLGSAALAVFVAGNAQALELRSPAFEEGGRLPDTHVFNGFGCSGGNVSPALEWSDPPAGTKSFAVTVYDPDAPTGSGWWHWTVFNIPADVRSLPAGAGDPSGAKLPPGAGQGRTDFGMAGYGGACPPPGDPPHRYIFTVWALDADRLPLDSQASGAMVGFNLNQHALSKDSLTTRYGR